ncbi:MAG: adenylate/guanylate cyclase domain-containing protein [Armatimonadetes bacterium]|nr:adenylate/guanylate cyclase domain-containing protein [Armatimonadota bacterium]
MDAPVRSVTMVDVYSLGIVKGEISRTLGENHVTAAMAQYHEFVHGVFGKEGGEHSHCAGDCCVGVFPTARDAVRAAVRVQEEICDLNARLKLGCAPLTVRIGVAQGPVPEVEPGRRQAMPSDVLDEAGHLEKACPPGRVLISRGVRESLRMGGCQWRPGPLVDGKGTFVLVDRAVTPLELDKRRSLSERQRHSMPLIAFPSWEVIRPRGDTNLTKLPVLLRDAMVVLGETRQADQGAPVGTAVSSAAATSDAVGAIEVLAAAQASPSVIAGVDEWGDTQDLAFERSLFVVGSPAVNLHAYAMNDLMKLVHFDRDPSGLLTIIAADRAARRRFPDTSPHSGQRRHFGFVALSRSPLNVKHTLLWVAGISGMGTHLAARLVRDLVLDPLATLAQAGIPECPPPVAMVVEPASAPYGRLVQSEGRWRIDDYQVVWSINEDGAGQAPPACPVYLHSPDVR